MTEVGRFGKSLEYFYRTLAENDNTIQTVINRQIIIKDASGNIRASLPVKFEFTSFQVTHFIDHLLTEAPANAVHYNQSELDHAARQYESLLSLLAKLRAQKEILKERLVTTINQTLKGPFSKFFDNQSLTVIASKPLPSPILMTPASHWQLQQQQQQMTPTSHWQLQQQQQQQENKRSTVYPSEFINSLFQLTPKERNALRTSYARPFPPFFHEVNTYFNERLGQYQVLNPSSVPKSMPTDLVASTSTTDALSRKPKPSTTVTSGAAEAEKEKPIVVE